MLDQTALAGMIFTLVLAMLVGGFILLFPLSRRLGVLIDAKVREQKTADPRVAEELRKLGAAVQALEREVRGLAERQQFTEQLLARREPDALASGRREPQ